MHKGRPSFKMPTRTIDKKYSVVDLPKAATFISNDALELKLLLRQTQTKEVREGENTRIERIPESTLWVQFRGGRLVVENGNVLAMLLNHKKLGASSKGFNIDPSDPTGLWREMGLIEIKQIATTVAYGKDMKGDLSRLTIAAVKKAGTTLDKRLTTEDAKGKVPELEELQVGI